MGLEYIFNLEIIFYLEGELSSWLTVLSSVLNFLLLKFFANGFDSLQVQGA